MRGHMQMFCDLSRLQHRIAGRHNVSIHCTLCISECKTIMIEISFKAWTNTDCLHVNMLIDFAEVTGGYLSRQTVPCWQSTPNMSWY
jgi:hypothetical protein